MKKLFITMMVAVGMFALTACGQASNTLIMATNAEFPPYEFRDGDKIVGIDAEIGQAIADDLGMEFKIEDMAFDSVVAAVQSGKANVAIAGLTVTEDRKQSINFTEPYAEAAQVIVVKSESTLSDPEELKGCTVGVQLGTTGDIYAEDIEDVQLERYAKPFDAISALCEDKIDAVIIDRQPAREFAKNNDAIKIVDKEFTVEEYAIGINKNDTELLNKVNESIARLKESGKIDEIVGKYIKAE